MRSAPTLGCTFARTFLQYSVLACGISLATLAASHPLDPLTTNEITSAVEIVRREGKASANAFFPIVSLQEPPKAQVLSGQVSHDSPRRASLTAYELDSHHTFEGVVDLKAGRTTEWRAIPRAEPLQTTPEFKATAAILKTNELWIAALQRRGLTNLDHVDMGAIPIGPVPLLRGDSHVRNLVASPFLRTTNHNVWVPVEGLMAFIDMSHRRVIEVRDRGVYPLSQGTMDFYDPAVRGPQDPPQSPLQTLQPNGPGFRIDGHSISWNRWRFRYSMHPRDGLILHQIGWEESPGKIRPILYRASISDLLVPYFDPDEAWSWRAYFDEADFGIGYSSVRLKRGFTTVSYATLLSEPMPDGAGGAYVVQDVVDIYERDAGILWSHTETDPGTVGPRARELVIGCLATVGNYDYRFQWGFREDGSIELHVYLTGVMQLKGTHATACEACSEVSTSPGTSRPAGEQAHGVLVSKNLIAPHHQHFFNVRLDFDVDGTSNAVKEYNLSTDKRSRSNPHGNAVSLSQTVFSTERQAVRDLNPASHRMWAIFNPDTVSNLGHPTAYLVDPGMMVMPFLHKESPVRKRAGYIDHHFFATRYQPSELYAAGTYPGGHGEPDNLIAWTRNNEKIFREDVVAWVTIGVTHVARPEDFPVMPAAHTSLRISPKGFFQRNPALSVPDAAP